MGEIANDIVEGSCCQLCLKYFKNPDKNEIYTHEYPVVCKECWQELTKKERKQYQLAEVAVF